jgi:hypothetical protein
LLEIEKIKKQIAFYLIDRKEGKVKWKILKKTRS